MDAVHAFANAEPSLAGLQIDKLQYNELMDVDLILKAIANPHRRQMLAWLSKPRAHFPDPLPEHADLPGACVSYIYEKSVLSQATTSQYLHQLEQAGLITRSRHGRWTFFHRNEAAIAQALEALRTQLGAS
ncbi:MAG: ArsR/SmtB family transcription factor [Paracoccaceae bacterium]